MPPFFHCQLGCKLVRFSSGYKLLSESEQTASLYTLLQHAKPAQVKFLAAVLTQMSDNLNAPNRMFFTVPDTDCLKTDTLYPLCSEAENKSKAKQTPRSLRPPSLNLPLASPVTPQLDTPVSAIDHNNKPGVNQTPQDVVVNGNILSNWANEVKTPLVRMFPKGSDGATAGSPGGVNPVPAIPVMNTLNMAMLNQMGFSNEAQLLAVQMVMSGLIQPAQPPQQPRQKPAGSNNWRSPSSAKYPSSALRTPGLLKTSGLKSSGLRSSGLRSATPLGSAGATPKDSDDIDPELLKDVPAWLKSLRLHKYTSSFEGMTWQEMVELDDAALEAKGVVALGARRRLLRTFELVKRKMGMDVATPVAEQIVPSSAVLPTINTTLPRVTRETAPHSAAP